jgi:hypothetical protein
MEDVRTPLDHELPRRGCDVLRAERQLVDGTRGAWDRCATAISGRPPDPVLCRDQEPIAIELEVLRPDDARNQRAREIGWTRRRSARREGRDGEAENRERDDRTAAAMLEIDSIPPWRHPRAPFSGSR